MGDENADSISGEYPENLHDETPSVNQPTFTDPTIYLTRMLDMMMADNRRRDEMMQCLVDRLTPNSTVSRTATSPVSSFHIMPDLTKSIQIFDGEPGFKADEW